MLQSAQCTTVTCLTICCSFMLASNVISFSEILPCIDYWYRRDLLYILVDQIFCAQQFSFCFQFFVLVLIIYPLCPVSGCNHWTVILLLLIVSCQTRLATVCHFADTNITFYLSYTVENAGLTELSFVEYKLKF